MFCWIRSWWWARQRQIDLDILWPACKEKTPSLEYAKAIFAVHAYHDPAWIKHYGEQGLYEFIEGLK